MYLLHKYRLLREIPQTPLSKIACDSFYYKPLSRLLALVPIAKNIYHPSIQRE